MPQETLEGGKKAFSSPEEEIQFLRQEVLRHQAEAAASGVEQKPDVAASMALKEYAAKPVETVLAPAHALAKEQQEAIVLELSPEAHDRKIEELIGILEEKGIKNTLGIVKKLGDFHLDDDFHRFLVQYLKAGFAVRGLKEKTPVSRALRSTLYEITLPELSKEEGEKELKQLISGMEQFYAGMLSISADAKRSDESFSIEIANPNGSSEFIFYVSVPDEKRPLFEKQILSIFHNGKIREVKDDYNIFNQAGASVASVAVSERKPVFPLKTYEQFDIDPLNVLLNGFSKINKHGQGAAAQFILRPAPPVYLERYREALVKLQKGQSVRRATDIRLTFLGEMMKGVKDALSGRNSASKKKEGEEPAKVDELAVEQVKNKVGSPLLLAGIRIVASAENKPAAEAILGDLEAAFNQFENTHGNKLSFERVAGKWRLSRLLHDFSFRIFEAGEAIPLNLKEVTTMMHFPSSRIQSSPQLKHAKAGSAPAPLDLPQEGILLGVNRHRAVDTKIYMTKEDRLRHFYCLGQTGTGKTTLLKNMIVQDIVNGEGVCFIDPHGGDVQDILASVPASRYEDLIYFDPSQTARPMALNMLEYDRRFPEQKTFVVNEMLSIFNKLFDMKTAGGPMFEQYFRNAVLLTIEDPESGNTLLDVSRVLANKTFREMKLSRCGNPIVVQFWREVAEKAGGEAALANIVPYITSKFDNFLANDIMRPIIAQEKSSFNFREIMDGKKILLVNLAKGRLGDINANLIGLILVGKILMAALSRADSYLPAGASAQAGGMTLPPFYLYIDEFQNITTDSIATILSEARKYKLSLTIAHQFIKQLEEKIRDAVFGNVGSLASFRVGSEDAEFLEKQFEPVFTRQDIINLDNHHAYLKLLVHGRPVKPFNIETVLPPSGNTANIEKLKELSYLKFGRERAAVEAEIMKKYQQ
ncbi:MAG: TraM recognition domain-containing protein [Candidatus Taylorbacteria bacterium]|nr:TraM recognition domain-containing protein [Candidatus Taylorbacteria bacterium]